MYWLQPHFGISDAEIYVSIVCFLIGVFQFFLEFVSFVIFGVFFESWDFAGSEISGVQSMEVVGIQLFQRFRSVFFGHCREFGQSFENALRDQFDQRKDWGKDQTM